MMMKKILLGLGLLFCAGAIQAEGGPNWNFLGLSYQSAEVEDETLTGLGISGSASLGEHFFLVGGFSTIGTDVQGVDLDQKSTSLGLGYRYGASATTDIFAVVSYDRAEFKLSSQAASTRIDGNGYGIELGVRSLVTNKLELLASIVQTTFEDESETAFSVSALYHINEHFAVGPGYGKSEDVDILSLSAVLFF